MKRVVRCISLAFISAAALLSSQCLSADANEDGPDLRGADFANPERGWYRSMETQDATFQDLYNFRKDNITLVAFETYLGAYLGRDLDQKKLDEIELAFSFARRAGLSVIYRAAYDFEGKSNPDPSNINTVLKHISQLKPIFYKYEDILFNVQAGFLGPWGEWHHSRYGDPVKPEIQKTVANALLDAVPSSVTIAVRRPEYVRNIAGTAPLTAEEAFGGSTLSRMAFHNDALMSEETDMDTYIDPDYQPREKEFAWINNHTRWTPFIGETNKVSRYNDSENAIRFLDLMNALSLNIEYHPEVLKKWKRSSHGGMSAYDYIGMKLGYRFDLREVKISAEAEAGGIIDLDLEIMNTGFGHLMREKNFELVLKQDSTILRAKIDEDARYWNKNEPVSRSYHFQLPSDIPEGDWEVYLALTSTFESLAGNPAYSVRFSNDNIWDAKLGLNRAGSLRIVNTDEAGNGTEFKQLDKI